MASGEEGRTFRGQQRLATKKVQFGDNLFGYNKL